MAHHAFWFSRDLHEATNTLCPGDIHMIAGRTKEGKSTFLENQLFSLVLQGFVPIVDITEMTVEETIGRTACARTGLPWNVIRRTEFDAGQWRLLPQGSKRRYEEALDEVRALYKNVKFYHNPVLTPKEALLHQQEAKDGVYILDSITQLNFYGAAKKNEAIELFLGRQKEYAVKDKTIVIDSNQFNRDDKSGSTLFDRPSPSWFQGSSRIEQICSQAIGITRALRTDLGPKQFLELTRAIKNQQKDRSEMYLPNTSAIHIMLHRDLGEVIGKRIDLFYWFGRLVDTGLAQHVKKDPSFYYEHAGWKNAVPSEIDEAA